MSFKLEIDLKPLLALKKRLQQAAKLQGEVGFFPEDRYGPDNENLPVARVAQMQQRGEGNYPSRPFFDDAVSDAYTRKQMASELKGALVAVLQGNEAISGLTGACRALEAEVQTTIIDYPGSNSPDWAAFKGKDDPLSHTDTMLNAVKFKITERGDT